VLRAPRLFFASLLGSLLAPALSADRLVTHDGRILEVKKARQNGDGSYRLEFEHGAIDCPARFVGSVEIEGDMSDYVPQNEDERRKLADGYVRYRGKWLSKPAYEAELGREAEARRARTAELAAHAQFATGWEKETRHFRFKTNTSPELLDFYADLLEAYYDLMDKRVGIDPSPSLRKTKMKVNIYKSQEDFQKLTGSEPNVLGFFNFVREELQFYHDYQDPARSEWVALHEGTHLLTYLIEPQGWPQIWVNEGVADYFGSSQVTRNAKGKLEIAPGQLKVERVLTVQQAIAEQKHIPLDKLFFIDRDDYQGFEYAHGWSFVYFLNNSPYEKGFKKFFKDFYTIAKGIPFTLEEGFPNQQGTAKIIQPAEVKKLLLERLGVKDLAKLEQEWLDFVKGIPIDAPRARFERSMQSLYGGSMEELKRGLEDAEAAITGGIDDPRVYWTRGTLRLICEGKQDECLQDYHKAVELAPLEAGFRHSLAQRLSGMSLRTASLTVRMDEDGEEKLRGGPEELGAAREHFGLATELAPENELYRESFERFLELYEKAQGVTGQ
jgi:hypothetical protein